jgi:hypothetical protein
MPPVVRLAPCYRSGTASSRPLPPAILERELPQVSPLRQARPAAPLLVHVWCLPKVASDHRTCRSRLLRAVADARADELIPLAEGPLPDAVPRVLARLDSERGADADVAASRRRPERAARRPDQALIGNLGSCSRTSSALVTRSAVQLSGGSGEPGEGGRHHGRRPRSCYGSGRAVRAAPVDGDPDAVGSGQRRAGCRPPRTASAARVDRTPRPRARPPRPVRHRPSFEHHRRAPRPAGTTRPPCPASRGGHRPAGRMPRAGR